MTLDISSLKRVAELASHEWEAGVGVWSNPNGPDELYAQGPSHKADGYNQWGHGYSSQADKDAEYLSALNPQTVLRLIARIERYKSALEFYADRSVYYKANQFPGDNVDIECGDIARQALKEPE